MINITITDFIITILVISFCTSIIVGTLVYCVLKKKYDEDIDWLFGRIANNHTAVSRLYNKYGDHIAEHHKGEDSLWLYVQRLK